MHPDLAFYASIGAALFPIPANSKTPTGIISSFKHDWSHDPGQWAKWAAANPNCNWGMVAGPSRKIVVDIDTKKVGREAAWSNWVDICRDWKIPVYQPRVHTPSGGWHLYFEVNESEAELLRQPSLIHGVIDIRAGWGFVMIPPSTIDGRPYILVQ